MSLTKQVGTGAEDEPDPSWSPPRARWVLVVMIVVVAALLFAIPGSDDPGPADRDAGDLFEWSLDEGPPGRTRLESLQSTPAGFVMLVGPDSDGTHLWTSVDGTTWSSSPLSKNPNGITHDGTGLVAFRENRITEIHWDGGAWLEGPEEELPAYVRIGYFSDRPGLVFVADGILAHTVDAELLFSADGEQFEVVVDAGEWWSPEPDLWERFTAPIQRDGCRPPRSGSPDYPVILETGSGLAAFVPALKLGPYRMWPICQPELWTSVGGRVWTAAGEALPFGPGAYLYDVESRDGRLVAVGGSGAGRAAIWVADDPREWRPLDIGSFASEDVVLTKVVAGELGWVVLGEAITHARPLAWFSADGVCWHMLPEEVAGGAVAIGDDRLIFADSRWKPAFWVGELTMSPADIAAGC